MELELGGRKFEMVFPSVARVAQLQKLTGVDIFADAEKMDKNPMLVLCNLDSDEKVVQVVRVLTSQVLTAQDVQKITSLEMGRAINLFFTEMLRREKKAQTAAMLSPGSQEEKEHHHSHHHGATP